MKPTVSQVLVATEQVIWWMVGVFVMGSLAVRADACLRAFVEGR